MASRSQTEKQRNFIVTRGDSRIAVTVPRNSETVVLNRDNRFIIDDPDTPDPLAYILSKPLKLGGTFNNQGYLKFVLQEATTTDDDDIENGIADYYKHFPRSGTETTDPPAGGNGRRNWL